jgi:hypothetical protein
MEQVLGTPLVSGLDQAEAWRRQPPERLAMIARRYGAEYVLTRDDWHPSLPGKPLDRLAGWTVWKLAP